MEISLPGVDVLSPGADTNLQFTSRAESGAIVHQSGTISRGGTIYFPTLSYVPMALATIVSGSTVTGDSYQYDRTGFYKIGWVNTIAFEPCWVVTTNSLYLAEIWPNGGSYTARYVIFRVPGS